MSYTRGFRDEPDLDLHFDKHGSEFGANTKEEYQELADAVFGLSLDEHTKEFTRACDGAKIRASDITEAICILRQGGVRLRHTLANLTEISADFQRFLIMRDG